MAHRWSSRLATAATLLVLACSPRFEWREVRTDAGMVASLPGRPQSVTRELNVDGQPVAMTMTSTGVGPTMFAIGTARMPPTLTQAPGGPGQAIAYFRDALVRNIGGTVTSSAAAPLTLVGGTRKLLASEAVEAVGRAGPDGRKSRLAARFFIVDDQFFQVVALGAEGEIPPDVLDTFFTSFRLAP